MRFDLTRPCENCPFRKDGKGVELLPGRWKDIKRALIDKQATFSCHKTIEFHDPYLEEQDGEADWHIAAPGEQHCAGALITLEKMGRPNQIMRIFERLGGYDPSKLDMSQDAGFGPHKKREPTWKGNGPRKSSVPVAH